MPEVLKILVIAAGDKIKELIASDRDHTAIHMLQTNYSHEQHWLRIDEILFSVFNDASQGFTRYNSLQLIGERRSSSRNASGELNRLVKEIEEFSKRNTSGR